ncbi:MAG: S-formylglutathione hydrolase [Rhodobacterales bacterium]|jgi:S-formylglutathione hydrolase|nr:S-formylglutathione hydrolase [Rhodobacterales bacterium]|tara:strand:+ start:135 stop:968 length:834 start_codon:yes stop_codon:yes gene_type:complete
MKTHSENKCFEGMQGVYQHWSEACNCDMTFGIFMPSIATSEPVPLVWYLSGLTCTHENAMTKAGAQAAAEEFGVAIVFPDTSPRGNNVPDDDDYDLGQGAGFYLNATEQPWVNNFKMWDYITLDLTNIINKHFNVDMARQSIMGHSMGGHGALTIGMGIPGRFKSISALSPICNPTGADWGRKQLAAYLGNDEQSWVGHDSSILMSNEGFDGKVLIDIGSKDQFMDLLRPETLANAMTQRRQPGEFRIQSGYDHSYFFVSTFIDDHLAFHADLLNNV